ILGMHRSGTSLITELLQDSGLYIGRNLNTHFESKEYLKLNQLILRYAHADWDVPMNIEHLFKHKDKKNQIVNLISQGIYGTDFKRKFWGYSPIFRRKKE